MRPRVHLGIRIFKPLFGTSIVVNHLSPNISRYYIWRFIAGFNFIYTLHSIYPLSRGITVPQLALYISTLSILTTVLEIPTGYIADKFSRKLSISLGFLCAAIGNIGYIFISDIYTLLPLALVFALSRSLNSGAEESLIYDDLIAQNEESIYLNVRARGALIGTSSEAVASFSGPILYLLHYSLPFVFSAVTYLCLTVYVLTFQERKPSHEVTRQLRLLDGVKNVFRIRPLLLIVGIETLLLVFAGIYYQILYFPKINALGLDIRYLGLLDVVNIGFVSLLLYLLPRLIFKGDKTNLVFYTVAAALVFVVFSNSTSLVPAMIFGVLFDSVWAIRSHIVPTITNKYLESHGRALSLSSMSFVSSLGSAILIPLATFIFDVSYLFTIVPAIVIAIVLYFFPKPQEVDSGSNVVAS